MRVIATQRGHDGMQIREVGEEFNMPDNTEFDDKSWFEKVTDKSRAKAAKNVDTDTDLSRQGNTGSGTTTTAYPNGRPNTNPNDLV